MYFVATVSLIRVQTASCCDLTHAHAHARTHARTHTHTHTHSLSNSKNNLIETQFCGHNNDTFVSAFFAALSHIVSCDHLRALELFLDSISSGCAMRASPCQFPRVLQRFSCDETAMTRAQCQDCVTMGYDVDLNATGVYSVRTRSRAPFCVG